MVNGDIPAVWEIDTKTGVAVNTAVRELEKRYAEMEQALGLRPPSVSYAGPEDKLEARQHEEDVVFEPVGEDDTA